MNKMHTLFMGILVLTFGCQIGAGASHVDRLFKKTVELGNKEAQVKIQLQKDEYKLQRAQSAHDKLSYEMTTPRPFKKFKDLELALVKADAEIVAREFEVADTRRVLLKIKNDQERLCDLPLQTISGESFWTTWKGGATVFGGSVAAYMLWRAGKEGLKRLAKLDFKGFWQAIKHNGRIPAQPKPQPVPLPGKSVSKSVNRYATKLPRVTTVPTPAMPKPVTAVKRVSPVPAPAKKVGRAKPAVSPVRSRRLSPAARMHAGRMVAKYRTAAKPVPARRGAVARGGTRRRGH